MQSQYFGHEHPLVFNEEQSNQGEAAHCSRCGEMISGPSFSCADCGFYLHKECAQAPSQINHPFHHDHPLCLRPNPTYEGGRFVCTCCGKEGEKFVYNCSCGIDLHIKCALFTCSIAEKNFGELKGLTYEDPSNSPENNIGSSKCCGCWEPLDSAYYSLDRKLNLHKKCAELSSEIDYPHHYKHLLILQFIVPALICSVCGNSTRDGLGYCCSLCNFVIHIACLSPPSTIEGKGHQHPFTLFLRRMSFICDACGVEENSVPYMCSNCNLLVHMKCISLLPIIKLTLHEHPIFHTYFLKGNKYKSKSWDCVICHQEVNTDHGSYYCSDCHFVVHVNCATKRKHWYYEIESLEKFYDDSTSLSDIPTESYKVIERNEGGEATKIKHCSHGHELMLSEKILEDAKLCEGCTLSISDSFYYCFECNFFLHKKCAQFPKKKDLWFHLCRQPAILSTGSIFKCSYCRQVSNGFAYECHECGEQTCLPCTAPLDLTYEGHEHPLSYYIDYGGPCTACGDQIRNAYKCKTCKFAAGVWCIRLPLKARHKCDEHLLVLTYHDHNTYSESHFCDICEEDRNPSHWFYYCAICDNSAHTKCVLGRYPFVKSGKIYERFDHSHPVTLVKKMYDYPKCFACGDPCQELALECADSRCEFIAHWDCVCPSYLRE